MDVGTRVALSHDISTSVSLVLQKRVKTAHELLNERMQSTCNAYAAEVMSQPVVPWEIWNTCYKYSVDFAQRSVLFWDTLRERGNNYARRNRQGMPPVLHFDYETVLDGRAFERPVNYALVKIIPPTGVTVDDKRRPYVIIDPRAGHGPGIGGFKDDSEVGVALHAGHPVYFVIFFPEPEPGQTLADVCAAEQRFVRKVRTLHPDSPKPAIVGNCQGGWAAMMLAASDPDATGPIVINGAPMSYWGGAWQDSEGDNPMRYAGGMLGGSWLSSFSADLGNGKFDGAHLVQNFENLNPANSLWDKYYNLFANIDTEPPRFLEFELWWGGYFLMNREEIEWITRNLFVGNKLWAGDMKLKKRGKVLDLRDIKSPIILFASMGDNITPPQQAFNWVGDVYGSTEEIKARGQVIVGLVHRNIGHLGIFVSGKVALKEHAQIVSVLKSIEILPPGLYGMEIHERKTDSGQTDYEVEFREYRLEDLDVRLNRFKRVDEKPFEAVAAVSDFNQRAYELFAQPLVQSLSNEFSAKLLRELHPLRIEHWAVSDFNPWLGWLAPAAQSVKTMRAAVALDDPARETEQLGSKLISASLDYYRAMRDAITEASFFYVYGNLFALYLADKHEKEDREEERVTDPRELPFVKEALASIREGGYAEAFARVAYLVTHRDAPLPLSRLAIRQEVLVDYEDLLPSLPLAQWRRIWGEQEIIARYEPELAIATLPELLPDGADRERLVTLFDKMQADRRFQEVEPTAEQIAAIERVHEVLKTHAPSERHLAAVSRS